MNSKLKVKRVYLEIVKLLVLIILFPSLLHAQNDTIKYNIGFWGLASTGPYAPFWLQSNQHGKISSNPLSAGLMAGIEKDFGQRKSLFHYGFKADLLLQTNPQATKIYFHELYGKARFLVFDLIVGSREENLGNQDSALSCGGLLLSKNARPMPKITIGIEHFIPVPFTYGYLEIKGALAHGWFNNTTYNSGVFLHHKYLYGRIGGKLPIHIQYGLDHVAQWGGNIPGLVQPQQPQSLRDYVSIFLGKSGSSDALTTDQINALGNHIISQSMRLDIDITNFKIGAYWQNVNEDGPIKYLWLSKNKPDGLWGISIRNRHFPFIQALVYEYLNTTDQSGPYHDRDGLIYGGRDSYFNNGVYSNGWSYYSRSLGTPFISSPLYNKNGYPGFLNNRVQVHHIGIEGNILGYNYKLLSSLSKNYGNYNMPYTKMIQNTSMLLEVNKQFPKLLNLEVGCSVGGDFGELYGNSVGCMISIRKTGNLFHY